MNMLVSGFSLLGRFSVLLLVVGAIALAVFSAVIYLSEAMIQLLL